MSPDKQLEWVNLPTGSVVTCRVCQGQIDISDKREQHVVKCGACNEATVSLTNLPHSKACFSTMNLKLNLFVFFASLFGIPHRERNMSDAPATVYLFVAHLLKESRVPDLIANVSLTWLQALLCNYLRWEWPRSPAHIVVIHSCLTH